MNYPELRLRRLRKTENLRALIRETHIQTDQLVMPYFVGESTKEKEPIESMPGQFRFSEYELMKELASLEKIGIKHILLFGIPKTKDSQAKEAHRAQGIIQKTVRAIKKEFHSLTVITDVCLCEYMAHGHCGIVNKDEVKNDPTLNILAETALSHAEAGADIVAPSDMMDGRVWAIRSALDESGFEDLPIMSYAAKYASAFYGPFREAADSKPQFGDRKSYQMDPANILEALREVKLDLDEGADIVMVKPASFFLDVIREIKQQFQVPVAAYQVSGEYSMIKFAAAAGAIDEQKAILESLLSIKRAGANIIISYFAKEAAQILNDK